MFRSIKARIYPSSFPGSQSQRWGWLAKAAVACAMTAGALHAPAALARPTCTNGNMVKESDWAITGNFANIANGVSIAHVMFSQTVTASQTNIGNQVYAVIGRPAAGPYQTIPLATFSGLGMKLSFVGYINDLNAELNPNNFNALIGTVIAGSTSNFGTSTFSTGTTTSNRKFRLVWRLDLVVTDVKIYAGGTGNFLNEPNLGANITFIAPIIYDGTVNQACYNVTSNFQNALASGGAIQLPELPKPPTPTCQFPISTMNQTIPLAFSTTGRVPANGSARTEGATAETRFNIQANNCGADSNYAIYFTDANAAGATKDYLNSSGALAGKVNLRLFQGANNVPVQFGPAPTGSSLPTHPAGVTNSLTPANSNFVHDFYVQYVRAPGVDASAVGPGSLAAQTIVTAVYP